jgi:hypothetical protein
LFHHLRHQAAKGLNRGCSTIFEKSYAKPSPQPALAYIAC